MDKLDLFIKEAMGKKYKFELGALSKRKSMKPNEIDKMIEDDRTFFCSELVAKLWKECGIMKYSEDASSNYLPGHFGS